MPILKLPSSVAARRHPARGAVIALALALLTMIAACGQKGPLVLPRTLPAAAPASAASAP